MSEYIVDVGNADEEYIAYFGQMAEKLMGNPIREEIVRCRDCRFSRIFDGKVYPGKKYEGMTYCINWSDGYQGEWVKPDGYCHRAKELVDKARKEGGDD